MSLLYEDLYIANENIIYHINKLNNLLEKLKQIYVKNPNNNYYNIY
jgi:hypothetical protein